MLRFLVLALFSLHLVNGEISSEKGFYLKPDDVNNNVRFTFEDGEYEIINFKTDWYSARSLCKMQGGELLSIESLAENSVVLQAIRDFTTDSFWTSGSDFLTEWNFYWDTTGASVENFTFWGPDQPVFNDTAHCVEMNSDMNHMWADAECDLEKLFICEFHPCSTESDVLSGKESKVDTLLTFTFENGTYIVPFNRTHWVDAKNKCKLLGMELVSIETFEEDLAILEAIFPFSTLSFWTSGSNLGHVDSFYWEATGNAVGPYTGWAPGHPVGEDSSQCIIMLYSSSHMWTDISCNELYHCICELQPCDSANSEY